MSERAELRRKEGMLGGDGGDDGGVGEVLSAGFLGGIFSFEHWLSSIL